MNDRLNQAVTKDQHRLTDPSIVKAGERYVERNGKTVREKYRVQRIFSEVHVTSEDKQEHLLTLRYPGEKEAVIGLRSISRQLDIKIPLHIIEEIQKDRFKNI